MEDFPERYHSRSKRLIEAFLKGFPEESVSGKLHLDSTESKVLQKGQQVHQRCVFHGTDHQPVITHGKKIQGVVGTPAAKIQQDIIRIELTQMVHQLVFLRGVEIRHQRTSGISCQKLQIGVIRIDKQFIKIPIMSTQIVADTGVVVVQSQAGVQV